ncbi:MAG: prepilin-type N-terminal cleavage/methylation domain-containing protein [Rhodoferax sp.]|nr:prepilin-type N-terminal cleavage/methylation domain-containing protein [Rhodoferax sp.]
MRSEAMVLRPSRPPPPTAPSPGYTLLELLVVLLILGLLAALGWPAYLDSVQRGQRAEARAALLEAQQFMERYHAANARYTLDESGAVAPALPVRLQQVPQATPRYRLSVTPTPGGYTLSATPLANDACGDLTLAHTGERGRSGSGRTVAECWR